MTVARSPSCRGLLATHAKKVQLTQFYVVRNVISSKMNEEPDKHSGRCIQSKSKRQARNIGVCTGRIHQRTRAFCGKTAENQLSKRKLKNMLNI